jgi:hypothetical protein
MKINLTWLLIITGAVVLPTAGVAQVTFLGAQKTAFYKQKRNNTLPAKPYNYSLYVRVTTSESDQTKEFTVSAVKTIKLTSDSQYFGDSVFYKTSADLDRAFPPGDAYTFTAHGGELRKQSGSLPIGADAYPVAAYLTGKGLTEAKNINPDSDFTVNVGYGTTGATPTTVALAIYAPDGELIYNQAEPTGTTIFTIPQSEIDEMTQGVEYSAQIAVFNVSQIPPTGSFSTASSSVGWLSTTIFTIEVQAQE